VPGNLPNALIVGYVGYIESTSSCLPESEKRVCAELAATVDKSETPRKRCFARFVNLPDNKHALADPREEMKNGVWLKRQLVAQIEFTERTLIGIHDA
jgi:hypothetical protein